MQVITTKNAKETKTFAKEFVKTLKVGDVVCLFGELGAGKTTFTQGLAEGVGIAHRIMSPTFIIMRSYKIDNEIVSPVFELVRNGEIQLYHIDLYRTESEADIQSAGVVDILGKPNTIAVVEWPEKLGDLLPQKRIELHFERIDDDTRKIILKRF